MYSELETFNGIKFKLQFLLEIIICFIHDSKIVSVYL